MAYFGFICLLMIWGANGLLIPDGREWEYSFNMKTRLTTVPIASDNKHESSIFGMITMRRFDEYSMEFVVDDIKSKIIRTSEKFKADAEAPGFDERLTLRFFGNYGEDGKLLGIDTVRSVDFKSLNTMKAIASQFQIDSNPVTSYDSTTKTYETIEDTIYGSCPTSYSVEPKTEKSFTMIKMLNCTSYGKSENFDIAMGHCDIKPHDPIFVKNEKKYEMVQKPYGWVVDSMVAKNEISMMFPYDEAEKVVAIEITQEYKLKEDVESNFKFKKIKDMINHKIKIEPNRREIKELYHISDRDKIPEMLNSGLKNTLNVLDTAEIKKSELNMFHRNSLLNMLKVMRLLDFESLKGYFETLKNDDMEQEKNLFISILPLAGTNDATMLIFDIIKSRSINDTIAGSVMIQIPFNLRNPNIDTLDKMLELFTPEISPDLYNSALMAYASLVNNALKMNPEDEKLQLKIDDFIDEFKKGDYDKQILFSSALANIISPKVFEFFAKIVKNETDIPMKRSSHIRSMALKSLVTQNLDEPETMSELCWPILEDTNEDIEMRAMALEVLMMNPSEEDMNKIFKMMQDENDEELYNFYFTMLKSIANVDSPCFKKSSGLATELLAKPRRRRPKHAASMAHFLDSFGMKMGVGALVKFTSVGNFLKHKFMRFKFQINQQRQNYNIYRDTVIVYARPVNVDDERWNSLLRAETFMKYLIMIQKMVVAKLLKVEVVTYRKNKIISVKTNLLDDYIEEIRPGYFYIFPNPNETTLFQAGEWMNGDVTIVTDVGGFAVYSIEDPVLVRTVHELSMETLDNGIYKRDTDVLYQQIYGMKVFQPINSAWQGVRRNLIVNLKVPIDLQFKYGGNRGTAQLTVNLAKDDKMYEFIAQAFIYNEFFVEGPSVMQHCEWCNENMVELVLLDEIKPSPRIIDGMERTSEFTNTTYKFEFINCDTADGEQKNTGMCGMKLSAKPKRTKMILDIAARIGQSDPLEGPLDLFSPSLWAKFGMKMMQKDEPQETIDAILFVNSTYSNTFNTNLSIAFDKPDKDLYTVLLSTEETNKYTSMDTKISLDAGYNNEISLDIDMKSELPNKIDEEMEEAIFQKCLDEENEIRPCTKEQTLFRKYTMDVNLVNITQMSPHLKDLISMFFLWDDNDFPEQGKIKYTFELPIDEQMLKINVDSWVGNATIQTPMDTKDFSMLTSSGHVGWLIPMSEFPFALYETCRVDAMMMTGITGESKKQDLEEEWTAYMTNYDKSFQILLKRIGDGKIAIQVKNFERVMEIHPKDGFEITIDGEKMDHDKYGYYRTEWFDFKVTSKRIFVHLKTVMSYFDFDGNTVDMALINLGMLKGRCYE